MSRKYAREKVYLFIFERGFNKDIVIDEMIETYLEDEKIEKTYFKDTVNGVFEKEEEIKEYIKRFSASRKLSRISKTLTAGLYLAIYEMLYTDIPDRVAINEAIELIKMYDADDSHSFANGLLSSVYKLKNENIEDK